MVHHPLLSRLMDDQPGLSPQEVALLHVYEARERLDGSIHDEQHCHACGVSSRAQHMHPVVRSDGRGGAETLFFCAELGPCTKRAEAATS